jgi:hypothetical protein
MLSFNIDLRELPMTAPHAREGQILPRPACTPAAIRVVLAANAGPDVLQRYDDELDAAFEQAREQGDLTPLVQTVRRWWFEADAWRDPALSTSSWPAWTVTAATGRRSQLSA